MEDLKRYGGDLKFEATELRLGLPGSEETKKKISESVLKNNKRSSEATAPQEKVRVVGWPPIRSFRKNSFHGKKSEIEEQGTFVKVSMDGAPYLRKIDLRLYKGYSDLLMALKDMFKCFNLEDKHGSEYGPEYATTYEDKDGDLMLVGDVPWEMFISSCKRLRIMKEHEIRGLDCGV